MSFSENGVLVCECLCACPCFCLFYQSEEECFSRMSEKNSNYIWLVDTFERFREKAEELAFNTY